MGKAKNRRKASIKVRKVEAEREPIGRLPRTEIAQLKRQFLRGSRKIVEPPINYDMLYELAERSYLVRMVVWAIVRECTRKTIKGLRRFWDFYPTFKKKCMQCGMEFQDEIETCPCGSVKFREPDPNQLNQIRKLLDKPNNTYTWGDIVKRSLYDAQVADDWFTSIGFDYTQEIPVALWHEDPRNMVICADDFGMLGNDEYFCPIHTRAHPERSYDENQRTCPEEVIVDRKRTVCGQKLYATAYMQIIDNKITARFAKHEIIHGTSYASGSRLFGSSSLRCLIVALTTAMAIDNYGYDAFSMQREPNSALLFTGTAQSEVDAAAEEFRTRRQQNPYEQLWLGMQEGQGLQYIKMLGDISNAGTIAEREFFRGVVCSVFGVSPVFVSIETPGRLGNANEVGIHVQNNTTESNQDQFAEQVNRDLLPLFKITDWYWDFVPVEPDDDKLQADILNTRATAAKMAVDAGFEVSWDAGGVHVKSVADTATVQRERMKSLVIQSLGFAGFDMDVDPSLFSGITVKGRRPQATPGFALSLGKADHVEDAPRGTTATQDVFYSDAIAAYEAAVNRAVNNITVDMSKDEVWMAISRELDALDVKLSRTARTAVETAYLKGLQQAAKDMNITLSMDGKDQDAIDYLVNQWHGVSTTLPEFITQQRDAFTVVIERAYTEPGKFALDNMVKEMRGVADTEKFKLERIARTETTLISNNGRINGYLKDPANATAKYTWSIAPDACDACKAIAAQGPMTLEELRSLTNGFCVHPNDRCTPVLSLEGLL
jgi:hypothetical protein